MPAIVMQVKEAKKHPNADSLMIYSFYAPNIGHKQIIANLENVYQEGDLVYVALEGSFLTDGTKVKPRKVRDVPSYGMALGVATEEIGTDCSDRFCSMKAEMKANGFSMIPWPDIESLYNIRRALNKVNEFPKLTYRAKIKIDGSNAGVQVRTDGSIAAESRTRIITPQNDNFGFATWVSSNESYFKNVAIDKNITIFGEYCGAGIQKRTAISKLDRKVFAVFAIQIGDIDAVFETEPYRISAMLPSHKDIFVLPWYGAEINLDFSDKDQLEKSAETINDMVLEVEKTDPWVKETFGIEGIGEGLVMYPMPSTIPRYKFSDFVFKAKGEKHKVVNSKKPVQLDPEFVATIDEFVRLFVTENRLEQGVTVACDGVYDIKLLGNFLKWFSKDVQKESVAELEKAGLKWKQVAKAISNAARKWYMNKTKEVDNV